jgi:molybdenum cofactor cytidylyltransferase
VITAIVLAGGASRRFGSQKLLADFDGEPVIRHSVRRLLAADPDDVLVVAGCDGQRVLAALDGLAVRIVMNDGWSEGLSSSLRVGIAALGATTSGALIALGDQPGVRSEDVRALLAAHASSDREIAVPVYRGERGHPVLFDRSVFPELLGIRGDRGAREVIERDPGRVLKVAFDAPQPLDVDTPEALAIARESETPSPPSR